MDVVAGTQFERTAYFAGFMHSTSLSSFAWMQAGMPSGTLLAMTAGLKTRETVDRPGANEDFGEGAP